LPGPPAGRCWLAPDGTTLAVADDRSVSLYDVTTGKDLREFRVGRPSIAFSPDGRTLATTGYFRGKSGIYLWDLETGRDRLLAELPVRRRPGINSNSTSLVRVA
jgi:WD40 repeat protein